MAQNEQTMEEHSTLEQQSPGRLDRPAWCVVWNSISTITTDCVTLYVPLFSLVKKGSPYSITERRVPQLIPVLGSQHAGDVSHRPGGRLPLLSDRPAVTLATVKRAATSFAAW